MTKARVQYPDGKGGYIEIEGDLHQGSMAAPEKQGATTLKVAENEAHEHMGKVLQYEQSRARDFNLTPEQRAFSMLLLVVSMREGFPGGTDAFDKINAEAYDYYLKNS